MPSAFACRVALVATLVACFGMAHAQTTTRILVGFARGGVASIPDFTENHKADKLRVVTVLGTKRKAAMPDVCEKLTAMGLPSR